MFHKIIFIHKKKSLLDTKETNKLVHKHIFHKFLLFIFLVKS